MKLIPVHELIEGKRIILIDDSIVRGTQLRETTEFLFKSGAKEVHARPACPPITFGCKFLNFSRSNSEMELIARQIMKEKLLPGRFWKTIAIRIRTGTMRWYRESARRWASPVWLLTVWTT